jgi:flagellar hook assembly protein FlgD
MLGQEVKTLVNNQKPAGFYNLTWDGKGHNNNTLPTGVYLLRMEAENFVKTMKMVFIQ